MQLQNFLVKYKYTRIFRQVPKSDATTKIFGNQSCLVMVVVNRSTLVNLSASLQGLIKKKHTC